MSISPPTGQFGPLDQKALLSTLTLMITCLSSKTHGQVPHPVGMWMESMMTNPPLYWYLVVIRTLFRVLGTFNVVSTLMTAFPLSLTSRRPLDCCPVSFDKLATHKLIDSRQYSGQYSSQFLYMSNDVERGTGTNYCKNAPLVGSLPWKKSHPSKKLLPD